MGAVGCSVSLVSPAEAKAHDKICKALGGLENRKNLWEFPTLDGRLISRAQERVLLATKIVSCEQEETKTQKDVDWMEQAALDAGLVLDNDDGDGGLQQVAGMKQRQLQQLNAKLQTLLSIPMQTQRYGKFFSNNRAAIQTQVAPYVTEASHQPKPKRRKRN